MNEILLKFKRLKVRCPNCGRKLQSTPTCDEWCEDCLWENGRKRGYCIIELYLDKSYNSGRSKIKDEETENELLIYPVEFDEFKHPVKYEKENILIKKDLYDKLSPIAKKIIDLVLSTREELLDVFEGQANNKSYNLCLRIIKTYLGSTIGYKEGNKILEELKQFVKNF